MADVLWAVQGCEEDGCFETIDAALENYFDIDGCGADWKRCDDVVVAQFKRQVATRANCGCPLENMLQDLDEEFGNPTGDSNDDVTYPTPTMKAAEQEFMDKVLAEYRVWACEETGETQTVNVPTWVRTKHADWEK